MCHRYLPNGRCWRLIARDSLQRITYVIRGRTGPMVSDLFLHSQLDYKNLLDSIVSPGCRWLDIGCGHTLVPDWIHGSVPFQRRLLSRCEIARGCDPVDDRPHKAGLQKYVGDCTVLPYPDGFFNLVTANMVVEHIKDTQSFGREVHRVLAPGGKFVFHTPNLRNPVIFLASLLPARLVRFVANRLDGRSHEDVFPTYYRMNTRRAISRVPGFDILNLRCSPTGPLLRKVPLVGRVESMFIRGAFHPLLEDLQADLIVILEKQSARSPDSSAACVGELVAS